MSAEGSESACLKRLKDCLFPSWCVCPDTVPECTVCQAATTGGVPTNCAVQPSIPYALTTHFHINTTVSETDEFPATFVSTSFGVGLMLMKGLNINTSKVCSRCHEEELLLLYSLHSPHPHVLTSYICAHTHTFAGA